MSAYRCALPPVGVGDIDFHHKAGCRVFQEGVGRCFSFSQRRAVRSRAFYDVERTIGFHGCIRGVAAATKPGGPDSSPRTAQYLCCDVHDITEYVGQVLVQAGGAHQDNQTAVRIQPDAAKFSVPIDGGERSDGIGVGSQQVKCGTEGTGKGCRNRVHDVSLPPHWVLVQASTSRSGTVYAAASEDSVHDEIEARAAQALAAVIGDEHRVAEGHGASAVGVHHDDVQEEHVAGLHLQRVGLVEHRRIDPKWVVDRAHAVAAGVHAVFAQARRVHDLRVRGEDLAHRSARPDRLHAGVDRIDARGVHRHLLGMGAAGEEGAHHRGVIAPPGARELEGELVLRVQAPASAEVSAQERARARSDDELVAGVVAAAAKHRALHRGEDVAFEGSGASQPHRFVPMRRRRAPPPCGRIRSLVRSFTDRSLSTRVEASASSHRPASSASTRRQLLAFSP